MSEKWKVDQSLGGWVRVIGEDGDSFWAGNPDYEPDIKRAHLIAAAPEMLELLRVSRRNVSSLIEARICEECDGWLVELKRVIALAEGEEK